MTEQAYITIRNTAYDEFTTQKSRFIGYASPCETEEEALRFLQSIRDKHRDARHHCYAYVIGQNSGIMRYSDDGEPGGTAGLPIMNIIRSEHAVNCCVVVVRYFGGILLGTGGLVRAYTHGCKIALQAAQIVRMESTAHEYCEVPYSVWDSLCHATLNLPVRILNPEFGTAVSFTLAVRSSDRDQILKALNQITDRRLEHIAEGTSFEPWEI